MEASQRLIAFTVHSGAIYKKTNVDVAVVSSLKESGESLTEVFQLSDVVANSFYNDRDNQTLYVQLSDSGNPNSRFLVLTRKLFFSNNPVNLPHDLDEGFDVFFEPQIYSTSNFGVELDIINEQTNAIEGSGTLTLYNDNDFWKANFDKLTFDNQNCFIYSYHRSLPASEAKLLFKGKVESKTYSNTKISFKLKDLLSELRNSLQLNNIEDLAERSNPSLGKAKQRMIFGRVEGFRPVNLDELLDKTYPLTGTVSWTNGSATVTGSGTSFKTELYPEDELEIGGEWYTVATIPSNTSLTLTENVSSGSLSGQSILFSTDLPKRFINREWLLAGHQLRQPETTIESGTSTSRLVLGSTKDLYNGDAIYVGTLGSGQLTVINQVLNDTVVTLSQSLNTIPPQGTIVHKPCVQNLRLNDVPLVYWTDYTVDAVTARLSLRDTAEATASSVVESVEQITTSSGSAVVTGTGTSFKSYIKPGYIVRPKGTVDFYQVLSVDSDTQLTLTSNFPSNQSLKNLQYKKFIFDSENDVLTCTILGRTDDNTSSGNLLKTAPSIVKALLEDAGLTDSIDTPSFVSSENLIPEEISFVIPEKFNELNTPIFRDVINKVNLSVFGILLQNNEFKFSYDLLRPVVDPNATLLKESDILDIQVTSTNKNMVYKTISQYGKKEYDYSVKKDSFITTSRVSNTARYVQNTLKEKTFNSYLINEADSRRLAQRWSFLLEYSSNEITVSTKLQTIDLQINDIIVIDYRKLYTRFGGTSSKKYIAVEKILKSGNGVTIVGVDLSNAFNRVALISDTTSNYQDSNEDTRIYSGFYTDSFGLINDDENSFFTNLIY
jgi:hypothetical protein